jgi:hypothetical protein
MSIEERYRRSYRSQNPDCWPNPEELSLWPWKGAGRKLVSVRCSSGQSVHALCTFEIVTCDRSIRRKRAQVALICSVSGVICVAMILSHLELVITEADMPRPTLLRP